MNKIMATPCLVPFVIEPVIDQPFLALNENLLSIQIAPQLQLGLEYNPGSLCKGGVSNVFCSFRLRCLLSFSITDHAFVAEFTVTKHLPCPVILGVEWWRKHNITSNLKDNLLRIAHPARISLEVLMILLGKEAPHISMLVSATIKHATSFDVLPLCLSHLHTAFDSKLADGLHAHSQFEFKIKLTVDLAKVTSPIYPMNLKEEQWLEE
ncbi:hypothetical protein DSO57_1015315 [Entomophthora muscae]|uniref:Uncharacterized protein n=1 Tax=Entomophthora muscae TaxID=34485 RepID=A0ACC2TFV5_9FUNG|nr:hypothetical protein DSO57_1015315 [Entomophthora muscae]